MGTAQEEDPGPAASKSYPIIDEIQSSPPPSSSTTPSLALLPTAGPLGWRNRILVSSMSCTVTVEI